ncbi:NepR family anti-sigma factor [Sagittula stellata]|uniref:NepR family anti-sigma factor n=1 Tax=Sagittula stellata TaxID=52603 RepID=UPI000A04F933|nr:NepR family anti-sigma factor [Sagittula stellata]
MNQERKSSRVQREIDENLKRAYGDMTKEEVPDRFTDLLDKLRAAESSDKPASNRGDNAQS